MGGLELGLEMSGMETVAQVEIDEFCLKVLEKHWPGVPKFKDIKEFNRVLSMLYAEDSRARICPVPAKEEALRENEAAFGTICSKPFAFFDQKSSSLKMFPEFSDGSPFPQDQRRVKITYVWQDPHPNPKNPKKVIPGRWNKSNVKLLRKSFVTLPKSVMMSAGLLYALPMLELDTKEKGFLSSELIGTPTSSTSPRSQEFAEGRLPTPQEYAKIYPGAKREEAWRTPSASDGEGGVMVMRPETTGHYKLRDQVQEVNKNFWPTPRGQDSYERSNWKTIEKVNEQGGDLTLTRKVKYVERGKSYPTPTREDYRRRGPNSSQQGLPEKVHEMYRTPQARDAEPRGQQNPEVRAAQGHSISLPEQIAERTKSEAASGTETQPTTPKVSLQLSADWTQWLMGFPPEWTEITDMDTLPESKQKSKTG